jgi:hypothetical protein
MHQTDSYCTTFCYHVCSSVATAETAAAHINLGGLAIRDDMQVISGGGWLVKGKLEQWKTKAVLLS